MNNPKEATGNEVMGHKEEGGSRNKKKKEKRRNLHLSGTQRSIFLHLHRVENNPFVKGRQPNQPLRLFCPRCKTPTS
jgi:hypothetical protein